mmetsp:Transcript_15525/g.46883  ORF Transcript_15525/g.46883 Transcript_15525/m.46883 type:complete len:246 (-) Transcript_15525:307-1044(-)
MLLGTGGPSHQSMHTQSGHSHSWPHADIYRLLQGPRLLQPANPSRQHWQRCSRWRMQVLSQEAAGDSVPSSAAESPVDRSQRRIENAQALVAEASEAASAGASTQTLQGQVLLCLAAVVLAVGRREQLMASLSQVALPDMAAAVLAVAALIRLAPSRAKMGIAHLSALLQSVFLLGSVAHDISEVKRDIKQAPPPWQPHLRTSGAPAGRSITEMTTHDNGTQQFHGYRAAGVPAHLCSSLVQICM